MRTLAFKILAALLPFFAAPIAASAQIVQCANLDTGCTLEDFQAMITSTYALLFDYVGILAVFFFIIGGVILITSGGNADRIRNGRQILGSVIVGVSIALLSYLIIDFVVKTLKGS